MKCLATVSRNMKPYRWSSSSCESRWESNWTRRGVWTCTEHTTRSTLLKRLFLFPCKCWHDKSPNTKNKMPECIREREISKLPPSKRWKANIARGLVYQIKKNKRKIAKKSKERRIDSACVCDDVQRIERRVSFQLSAFETIVKLAVKHNGKQYKFWVNDGWNTRRLPSSARELRSLSIVCFMVARHVCVCVCVWF